MDHHHEDDYYDGNVGDDDYGRGEVDDYDYGGDDYYDGEDGGGDGDDQQQQHYDDYHSRRDHGSSRSRDNRSRSNKSQSNKVDTKNMIGSSQNLVVYEEASAYDSLYDDTYATNSRLDYPTDNNKDRDEGYRDEGYEDGTYADGTYADATYAAEDDVGTYQDDRTYEVERHGHPYNQGSDTPRTKTVDEYYSSRQRRRGGEQYSYDQESPGGYDYGRAADDDDDDGHYSEADYKEDDDYVEEEDGYNGTEDYTYDGTEDYTNQDDAINYYSLQRLHDDYSNGEYTRDNYHDDRGGDGDRDIIVPHGGGSPRSSSRSRYSSHHREAPQSGDGGSDDRSCYRSHKTSKSKQHGSSYHLSPNKYSNSSHHSHRSSSSSSSSQSKPRKQRDPSEGGSVAPVHSKQKQQRKHKQRAPDPERTPEAEPETSTTALVRHKGGGGGGATKNNNNYSGAISTMSASAITFQADGSSTSTTAWSSTRDATTRSGSKSRSKSKSDRSRSGRVHSGRDRDRSHGGRDRDRDRDRGGSERIADKYSRGHSRDRKDKGGHSRRRRRSRSRSKSPTSYDEETAIIPHQVSFPSKEENDLNNDDNNHHNGQIVIRNLPKDDHLDKRDRNNQRGRAKDSTVIVEDVTTVDGEDDATLECEEGYAYPIKHGPRASPKGHHQHQHHQQQQQQHQHHERGDDPSEHLSEHLPKPNPPLRNPDAAKSRRKLEGRGRSVKSVSGGSVVAANRSIAARSVVAANRSVAARSIRSSRSKSRDKSKSTGVSRSKSLEPKGKSAKYLNESNRGKYDEKERMRSKSQDMKRGRGRRDLKGDREEDKGRRKNRSLSRGRATRHLERTDQSYDERRSRDRRKRRSRSADHGHHHHRHRDRAHHASHAPSYMSTPVSSRHKPRYNNNHDHDDNDNNSDDDASSYVTHSTASSTFRSSIDEEGYCLHHPDIELLRLRKDTGDWRVIRKRCPECMREECPPTPYSLDERSVREQYDHHRRVRRVRYRRNDNDDDRSGDDGDGHNVDHSNNQSFTTSSFDINNNNSVFQDLGLSFQTPEEMEEEESSLRLKRRLAARAYHFPGNTWCQDWMQYLSNTHTVLGLFFHHPLHPMGFQERLVILFGSIAVGLTISNFTYLYFIHNGISVEEEVFTLNSRHTDVTGIPVVSITKLMITLWTLGSFIHTCFDLGLWHMKACTLCRYQGMIDDRLVQWGRVFGLFIVMIACGAGGYAVLLRASIEYKGEGSVADEVEESIARNEYYQIEFEDKRSFRFLLGYLVEFVLALFVYYPMAVTVLFSGILGCGGRLPILGGRPREMKREKRYEMRKRQPKILKGVNIEESIDDFGGSGPMDASYDSTTSGPLDESYDATTIDYPVAAGSYRDSQSQSYFDEEQIV